MSVPSAYVLVALSRHIVPLPVLASGWSVWLVRWASWPLTSKSMPLAVPPLVTAKVVGDSCNPTDKALMVEVIGDGGFPTTTPPFKSQEPSELWTEVPFMARVPPLSVSTPEIWLLVP